MPDAANARQQLQKQQQRRRLDHYLFRFELTLSRNSEAEPSIQVDRQLVEAVIASLWDACAYGKGFLGLVYYL